MTSIETRAAIALLHLYADASVHPVGVARALAHEITQRGQALGVLPVAIAVRAEAGHLLADVEFDMSDDNGQPWVHQFAVPLGG